MTNQSTPVKQISKVMKANLRRSLYIAIGTGGMRTSHPYAWSGRLTHEPGRGRHSPTTTLAQMISSSRLRSTTTSETASMTPS